MVSFEFNDFRFGDVYGWYLWICYLLDLWFRIDGLQVDLSSCLLGWYIV